MKEPLNRYLKNNEKKLAIIEDSNAFPSTVQGIARLAARTAMTEAKALKIPVTYLKGNDIIKKFPDGTIEVVGKVPPKKHSRILKKGAVLHARKK